MELSFERYVQKRYIVENVLKSSLFHAFLAPKGCELEANGHLDSLEFNGGMEWWNGTVEWNSGMQSGCCMTTFTQYLITDLYDRGIWY